MTDGLFISHIEVAPRERCEVLDPKRVKGAFVRCYVQERSIEQALSRIRAAAQSLELDVVDVHWIVNDDHTDWEAPGDEDKGELASQARVGGEVIFDEFQAWELEAPDTLN
jgi:hypothetical protein